MANLHGVRQTDFARAATIPGMSKDDDAQPRLPPLALHLRAWRKHRGLTLQELADLAGTSYASISRAECQKQNWDQDFLQRVALALHCTPVDLLARAPGQADLIWSLWEEATFSERVQIEQHAQVILNSRLKP